MKKLRFYIPSIIAILVIAFCFLGFLFAPNIPDHVNVTLRFFAPCHELQMGFEVGKQQGREPTGQGRM